MKSLSVPETPSGVLTTSRFESAMESLRFPASE